MNAGGNNGQIVISFPGLSPADASVLAKELAQALDAAATGQIITPLARVSDDAQDLGQILVIAAEFGLAAALIQLAKDAGKGVVVGAANRLGQKVFYAIWPIICKWRTPAKVDIPTGDTVLLGEEFQPPARVAPCRRTQDLGPGHPRSEHVFALSAAQQPGFQALGGACGESVVARSYGVQRGEGTEPI